MDNVVPKAPEGVVDQETADKYLDDVISGDEPSESSDSSPDPKESVSPEPDTELARDELGESVSPEEADKDVAAEGEEPSTAEAGPESEVTEEGEEEPKEEGVLSDEEWDALPAMRYRADGQDWEIPGSKVEEDGVFIPTDQVGHITQLLAQGQAHQGSFQQTLQAHEAEVKNLAAELEGERAANQEISDKIEELVTKEGALEAFVEDQRKNWDTLKLQADLAKSKRATEHAVSVREGLEAHQEEVRVLPLMRSRLAEVIEEWGKQAGFDRPLQQRLYNRYADVAQLDRLFPKDGEGGRTEELKDLRDEMEFLVQSTSARPPAPAPAIPEPPKGAKVQEAPATPRRKRRKAPTSTASSKSVDESPVEEETPIPKITTAEEADRYLETGKL